MNFATFTVEFEKIKNSHPAIPTHIEHSEDVSGDYIFHSNGLRFCYDTSHSRFGGYLFDGYMLISSYDCDYCISNEFVYESVDSARCYNSSFLENCADTTDSHYCVDCIDLKDCFGCVRLTHKRYCFFNRQLTVDEYVQKLATWKQKPPDEILTQVEKIRLTHPMLPKRAGHNENSDYGGDIYYCKNCYYCFDVSHSENNAFMFDSHECKNCFDHTYGFQCELCYENNDSSFCYNSCFINYCGYCRDCDFCFNCLNCESCFGCIALSHKKYCFLNRQLTKEEYEKQVAAVKQSMSI